MKNVRVEIHMTAEENELLGKMALQKGRSRKNLCETEIRKMIRKQLFENTQFSPHGSL